MYNGPERRSQSQADHDLLIKIDANIDNFIKNFNAHVDSDEKNFGEQDKRLKEIEKSFWKGCGAVSLLVIAAEFMIKAFIK